MKRLQLLMDTLNLEPHVEGGYFSRTLKTENEPLLETAHGSRSRLSSIYYLLTSDQPLGYFHRNRSDIMHYYHEGDALEYWLIHADGTLERSILGSNLEQGHSLQLFVPGGTWKATVLLSHHHGYGLLSEAVSPGFEYEDMELGQADLLLCQYPEHEHAIRRFCKS